TKYCKNLRDDNMFIDIIKQIRNGNLSNDKERIVMKVMYGEFKTRMKIKEELKGFAYEIAAKQSKKYPQILEQLAKFLPDNKEFKSDIVRFRTQV
ncbi:MAG: hypothetical protein MRY83_19140, partial [Flavobacteriales bacterium]|nr:hypothetical protein [Flavobacteriales bacterium]